MAKDYIKLSEKHGVNPTITLCFWCGESTGVALLGKLPNDAEAPKETVIDYEPCDKCKKLWDQGVPVIEVSETPLVKAQNPLTTKQLVYPTGRHVVVKPEALGGQYEQGTPVLCTKEDFTELFKNVI